MLGQIIVRAPLRVCRLMQTPADQRPANWDKLHYRYTLIISSLLITSQLQKRGSVCHSLAGAIIHHRRGSRRLHRLVSDVPLLERMKTNRRLL